MEADPGSAAGSRDEARESPGTGSNGRGHVDGIQRSGTRERAGQTIWRRLSPLTRRIGRPERAWQIFAMGVVWGWLPCGLVYSALLLAAGSAGPASGALAMASFGLGTLPAVLAASGLGAALARLGGALAVRRSAGALLVVFGLWSVVGTWAMAGAHADHGAHAHVEAHTQSPAHGGSPAR